MMAQPHPASPAAKAFLQSTGVVLLLIAAAAMVVPQPLVAAFQIELAAEDAATAVRASTAGLMGGLGVFCLFCARSEARMPLGLMAAACAIGGSLVCRLAGLALVGGGGLAHWISAGLELGGAANALLVLRRWTNGAPHAED